jgi:hypothetical protein
MPCGAAPAFRGSPRSLLADTDLMIVRTRPPASCLGCVSTGDSSAISVPRPTSPTGPPNTRNALRAPGRLLAPQGRAPPGCTQQISALGQGASSASCACTQAPSAYWPLHIRDNRSSLGFFAVTQYRSQASVVATKKKTTPSPDPNSRSNNMKATLRPRKTIQKPRILG